MVCVNEVWLQAVEWSDEGLNVATATVIKVEGSAPRPVGTTMAIADNGDVCGSVTGGCVESAVFDLCQKLLKRKQKPAVVEFGYSDEEGIEVGLTCGGSVEVFIDKFEPEQSRPYMNSAEPFVMATVIAAGDSAVNLGSKLLVAGSNTSGSLGSSSLNRFAKSYAEQMIGSQTTCRANWNEGDENIGGPAGTSGDPEKAGREEGRREESLGAAVLFHSFIRAPRLLVFGVSEFAVALSRQAKLVGYQVVVCDPRAAFLSPKRFADTDEIVIERSDRYLKQVGSKLEADDVICILTHDSKFDVPAVRAAVLTKVNYIGLMGARSTIERRSAALAEYGIDFDSEPRLRGPIGLDLGSVSPEEVAVSILGEIISLKHSRTGGPLKNASGPVRGRT